MIRGNTVEDVKKLPIAVIDSGVGGISVLKELLKKGESKESILAKINKCPLSKSLKSRLREEVQKYG